MFSTAKSKLVFSYFMIFALKFKPGPLESNRICLEYSKQRQPFQNKIIFNFFKSKNFLNLKSQDDTHR